MKTCPNCRVVHPDEYNGTCQECGAGLSGISANNNFREADWRRQAQDSARETSQEQSLKRGDYSNVRVPDRLMEVAKAGAHLLEVAAGRPGFDE